MIAPVPVPITKKAAAAAAVLGGLMAALVSAGCTPAGPRAILRGERLLREGHPADAAKLLERALAELPREARAWNLLGLARHAAGQVEGAAQAYRQALVLDRNLAIVHYNLGCLLLEQGDAAGGVASLTSYCGLAANDPQGWLQLGAAQLQARQPEAAERSFQQALKLQPRSPEALNGLGLALVQRRRPAEAQQQFQAALRQDPGYGPAVLNSAVVAQQYLNSRSQALQRYRDYLALPTSHDRPAVEQVVRQLELELAPPPRQPSPTNPAPVVAAPPKAPESSAPSNRVALASRPATSPSPAVSQNPAAPTKAPAPPALATATNRSAPAPAMQKPAAPTRPAPQPKSTDVVRVETQPEPQPARDAVLQPEMPSPTAATRPQTGAPQAAAPTGTEGEKSSLVKKLNPASWFRSKDRSKPDSTTASSPAEPPTAREANATNSAKATLSPAEGSPPGGRPSGGRRYAFSSAMDLRPGDRAQALSHFNEGVEAQQRNRLREAIAAYQQAVGVDASFFEARYNLGLAAFEAGELSVSLAAYEAAVRLKPDATKARYNFASALERAGYPVDAADQLERQLAQDPADARAQLTLGTLYARKLGQPGKARPHYLKFLELDPRHPQATEVRFWLEANP